MVKISCSVTRMISLIDSVKILARHLVFSSEALQEAEAKSSSTAVASHLISLAVRERLFEQPI